MKVLVTGAAGMLAHAVLEDARSRGYEVVAVDRHEMDVTDAAAALDLVVHHRPDAVIQCAAFTAVDAAEAEEDEAFRINATGARNVARACNAAGARFVYPSTDYVFSGDASRPYRSDDPRSPINAYGRSKLAGEDEASLAERFLIVRTSWLYGPGGRNFVETMLRLSDRNVIRVVSDQHGRPTHTATLAAAILDLLETDVDGTFHVTDGGPPTTWYELACAILESARNRVEPVASSQFPTPASRPHYSVLDLSATEATLGRTFPDWRHSLARYLDSRAAV